MKHSKEFKNALVGIYSVEQDDAFVESTLKRLPSRGAKRLWMLLGNVAIWGSVLTSAILYFPEIARSTASMITQLFLRQMPDCESIAVPLACVAVLFVAVAYSVELIDNYYRSMLRRPHNE